MFLLLSVFSSLHLLKYLKHTYFYVSLKLSHFLYFPACNASLSLLLFLTRGLSPSCSQGKGTKPGQTLSAQRSRGHCVLTPLTRSSLLLASETVDSPILLLALDIHAHPCLWACVCPHSSCSSALGEGTAPGPAQSPLLNGSLFTVEAHLIIIYWSTNNNGNDTNDLICVSELPGSFKAVLTIIANLDFF